MTNLSQSQLTPAQLEQKFIDQLYEHEDCIPYAYQDSLGYWTIAVGRLIDKRKGGKLSDDECRYLLNNDIKEARTELAPFSWYQIQDQVRKDVLVELVFNMGLPNFLDFHDTIKYLTAKDYSHAVLALLASKWATQVGAERIDDIKYRLLNGTYK